MRRSLTANRPQTKSCYSMSVRRYVMYGIYMVNMVSMVDIAVLTTTRTLRSNASVRNVVDLTLDSSSSDNRLSENVIEFPFVSNESEMPFNAFCLARYSISIRVLQFVFGSNLRPIVAMNYALIKQMVRLIGLMHIRVH